MKGPYLQGIVVSTGYVHENRFSHLVSGYKTYLLKELCGSSETIKTYRNNMGGGIHDLTLFSNFWDITSRNR